MIHFRFTTGVLWIHLEFFKVAVADGSTGSKSSCLEYSNISFKKIFNKIVESNSIVFDRLYACEKSLVVRQQSYRALFANKFELQNGFQLQWCKLMMTGVLKHCSDIEVFLLIWI